MLQISTGKFFDEDNKIKHDEKFVFYSNVQIFREMMLPSPEVKVEQIETGDINCFVVSYQLITEKHPIVIKCGEQDFIQQFLLAWSFFFNCIAKTQKDIVQKICREKKVSSHDNKTASEISPHIVELGRRLENKEIEDFLIFFKNLVSTNRNTYKSIVAALKIIDDAKETLATNFDLAYSTLVYAIESLSQKNVTYVPSWDDYHQDVKCKIDRILKEVDEDKAESIKQSLIAGKQFKLRKRLESFINENLTNDYYLQYLGENTNTMRTSFLQKSLNNLYQLRSSFVHELKPLDVMLSSPHSPKSDYIIRFGEPYFTYSGLNRMIREIIINFTGKKVTDEREEVEWTRETSSVVIAELAPECWIHRPENFNGSKANKWFQEYINMLNVGQVTDQSLVMDKIESIFDNEKKTFKEALIHYYWVYNAIHNKDNEKWGSFLRNREKYLGNSFHFYVVILYLNRSLTFTTIEQPDTPENIDLDEFDQSYSKYLRERFYKSGLSLSGYTEAALLSAAANIAFDSGDKDRFEGYLNQALCEVASNPEKTDLIKSAIQDIKPVNIDVFLQKKNESSE